MVQRKKKLINSSYGVSAAPLALINNAASPNASKCRIKRNRRSVYATINTLTQGMLVLLSNPFTFFFTLPVTQRFALRWATESMNCPDKSRAIPLMLLGEFIEKIFFFTSDAFRCWLFATLLQLKVQIFVPLNKTIELVFLYLFFIVEYHLYFISRFTQKTPPEQRNLWLNEGIVLDPLRMGEILQG